MGLEIFEDIGYTYVHIHSLYSFTTSASSLLFYYVGVTLSLLLLLLLLLLSSLVYRHTQLLERKVILLRSICEWDGWLAGWLECQWANSQWMHKNAFIARCSSDNYAKVLSIHCSFFLHNQSVVVVVFFLFHHRLLPLFDRNSFYQIVVAAPLQQFNDGRSCCGYAESSGRLSSDVACMMPL